jgi:hypothetical protein
MRSSDKLNSLGKYDSVSFDTILLLQQKYYVVTVFTECGREREKGFFVADSCFTEFTDSVA